MRTAATARETPMEQRTKILLIAQTPDLIPAKYTPSSAQKSIHSDNFYHSL
jgi:hypothetical protein